MLSRLAAPVHPFFLIAKVKSAEATYPNFLFSPSSSGKFGVSGSRRMKKGKIFIISGPSGSGKTTLYKKLLESPALRSKLIKSISITTRAPRSNERPGRDYIFVSLKMFKHKQEAGHFLESQKVFDHFYGTPAKGVRDLLKNGKNVLLCIDVKGAKVVKRHFPEAVTIFIKAASLDILKKRLAERGSEDEPTIRLRLQIAQEELRQADSYDHIVINDNLTRAYENLQKIISQELANN